MLTKTDILQANDLPIKEVKVPEWGEDAEVYIRTWTAAERDDFDAASMNMDDDKPTVNLINMRARFCVLIICDETGSRLFDDEDAGELGRKSGAAIDRIFAAGQKLNGITDKDIDDLVKNSGASPA